MLIFLSISIIFWELMGISDEKKWESIIKYKKKVVQQWIIFVYLCIQKMLILIVKG